MCRGVPLQADGTALRSGAVAEHPFCLKRSAPLGRARSPCVPGRARTTMIARASIDARHTTVYNSASQPIFFRLVPSNRRSC